MRETSSTRSPVWRPARCAAPPSATRPIRGGPDQSASPMRGNGLPSMSSGPNPERSSNSRRVDPPSLRTSISTCARSTARCRISQLTSCQDRTALPSIAVIRSPPDKPARAAGVSAVGGESSARGSITPAIFMPQYTAIASSRLASGPARTIAIRLLTGCRLNARGRSAALIGPWSSSRSSSMRT